jgi:hypothetical protein
MNIFRAPIFAFAVLLILQAGIAAARVRGGLGEGFAEVDQKESSNGSRRRARKLDAARGGKTTRRTNAEASERELWWGGGHGWNNWNNNWGGWHKKHHWGHGWK